MAHLSLLLILTTFLLKDAIAMPIAGHKAVKFLSRFGYLDLPEGISGRSFRSLENPAIKDAISDYQEFNGLEVTGELDEETVELMEQPRCGLPDKPKKSIERWQAPGQKWNNPNSLTYKITKPSRTIANAEGIVAQAAAEWGKVTNVRISPVSYGSAVIEVSFEDQQYHGDNNPFGENILAHAYYPASNAIAGDVHVNEWNKNWGQWGRNMLLRNIIHEMGHSLGLDHSHLREALMFSSIINIPYNGLHNDDIAGIRSLYGVKQQNNWNTNNNNWNTNNNNWNQNNNNWNQNNNNWNQNNNNWNQNNNNDGDILGNIWNGFTSLFGR